MEGFIKGTIVAPPAAVVECNNGLLLDGLIKSWCCWGCIDEIGGGDGVAVDAPAAAIMPGCCICELFTKPIDDGVDELPEPVNAVGDCFGTEVFACITCMVG